MGAGSEERGELASRGREAEPFPLFPRVPATTSMNYANPGWLLLPASPGPPCPAPLALRAPTRMGLAPAAPLYFPFPPHTCRQQRELTTLGSNVCSCHDKNN